MKQCRGQMSMFSAEASLDPASRFPLPESVEARTMTVISGRKCCELLKNSAPLGSSVKTSLDLFEQHLMKFFPALQKPDIRLGHTVQKLGMSDACSGDSESPLWPRPTTGAPLCGGTGNFKQMKKLRDSGIITEEERRNLTSGNGGNSNPALLEWLMGFPIGWTDLDA